MKTNDDSFFADPIDLHREARAIAVEAMCQLLIWMADAPSLEDRGLRASVALYCVRRDLVDGQTLNRLGDDSDRTRQHVHKLAEDFRLKIGFKS